MHALYYTGTVYLRLTIVNTTVLSTCIPDVILVSRVSFIIASALSVGKQGERGKAKLSTRQTRNAVVRDERDRKE